MIIFKYLTQIIVFIIVDYFIRKFFYKREFHKYLEADKKAYIKILNNYRKGAN